MSSSSIPVHHWSESQSVGELGIQMTIELLTHLRVSNRFYRTVAILDVSENRELQPKGIDLLWCVESPVGTCVIPIEVKADRNSWSGNFFFETVSNCAKNTPGAFLSTTCDLYVYVFPERQEIFCIPLDDARKWFLENQSDFQEKTVSSRRENRSWMTRGRLIPIQQLLRHIPNIRCFRRRSNVWIEMKHEEEA